MGPPRSAFAPAATPPVVVPNANAMPYLAAAQQAARISQRSGRTIQLLVDDSQGIARRCFMCTDGSRIFASSSFLRTLPHDYQVAFFAHEFAHGDLGHSTVQRVLGTGLNVAASQIRVPMGYWLVASLAYAGGSMLTMRAVSRQSEREADLYAAQRLPLAGLTSQTLAQGLRTITALQGNGNADGWLSTHPSNPQRIAAIEALDSKHALSGGFQAGGTSLQRSLGLVPTTEQDTRTTETRRGSSTVQVSGGVGSQRTDALLQQPGQVHVPPLADSLASQYGGNAIQGLQGSIGGAAGAGTSSLNAPSGSRVTLTGRFCPIGGEIVANAKSCPNHGIALRRLTPQTFETAASISTFPRFCRRCGRRSKQRTCEFDGADTRTLTTGEQYDLPDVSVVKNPKEGLTK